VVRTIRTLAAASAILVAAPAFGESPSSLFLGLPQPVRGETTLETAFEAVVDPVYDDANGRSNELASSLSLVRNRTSLSYGLSSSFALGIVGSYAANRYCCSNGTPIRDSGFVGGGVFVDWSPGTLTGRSNLVRLGYEIRRRPDDSVLSVSDGQDRVFLRSDWSLWGGQPDHFRLGVRIDLDYGRPFEIQKAYLRVSAELAPRLALSRFRGWDADAVATAGYVVATDARENGTIFHNRRSTEARAGIELDLDWGRRRRDQIVAEAKHDFAGRNALNGWRFALRYRRRVGVAGS
jgi:hypothetical protein